MEESRDQFDSWAVVELLGHVRLGGRVTEEERFGSKLGRLDIPTKDGGYVTRYFSAASLYSLTACSEEAARAVALRNQPEPVRQWELPRPTIEVRPNTSDDDDGESDDLGQIIQGEGEPY